MSVDGMSGAAMEAEEQMYEDDGLSQGYDEYMEALWYIEEFKAIVDNEEEYADLLLAEDKIVEYQEVYVNYEHNSTDELKIKIDSLETIIIDISKKLMEKVATIPVSEKRLISVKDFEELYSIGEEAQRKLRKRIKDPLPFVQIIERGNVLYNCKEVEKWLENYKN